MSETGNTTTRKRGLARGLSALLGEEGLDGEAPATGGVEAAGGDVRQMAVDLLRPGRYQPRRHFDDEAIEQLAASIGDRGIVQPILVRPDPTESGRYEIIAGERRWRAAQKARLHEVPVLIKEIGDRDALELALVENIQRQDLTPLEEAQGYARLLKEFEYTQDELARVIGKSRSHIANMLRLLGLPDEVKTLVEEGALTMGHARSLLTADDPAGLARQVVERGLNVRQTEDLVRRAANDGRDTGPAPRRRRQSRSAEKDADTLRLEEDLTESLGLKVAISTRGEAGEISIAYESLEQLDDLLQRLGHG